MIREVAGLFLAPLAVTLPALMYFVVATPFYPELQASGTLNYAVHSLRPAILGGYAGMLLLGLPAHFILRRRGRVSLRDYALVGVGLAAIPMLGISGWMVVTELRGDGIGLSFADIPFIALDIVVFIACGAAVASAFWFVSVRK